MIRVARIFCAAFHPFAFALLAARSLAMIESTPLTAATPATPKQSVVLYFSVQSIGEIERFDALQRVDPLDDNSKPLADAVAWLLNDINLPPDWRRHSEQAADFVVHNAFTGWLDTSIRAMYEPAELAVKIPVGPDPATHLYAVVINARFAAAHVTGVKLQITGWTLPDGSAPVVLYDQGKPGLPLGPDSFPSAAARLKAERDQGSDMQPHSLTQFLRHSRIELLPKWAKPPADAGLRRPTSMEASNLAMARLVTMSPAALVVACEVLTGGASFGRTDDTRTRMGAAMVAQWQAIVGTADAPTSYPQITGEQNAYYLVKLGDVDPFLSRTVAAQEVVLPVKYGGAHTRAEYIATDYDPVIVADWDLFIQRMQTLMELRLPAATFPRFIPQAERDHLLREFATDRYASGAKVLPTRFPSSRAAQKDPAALSPPIPGELPEAVAIPGALVYTTNYLPSHTALGIKAAADSGRQFTGSAKVDRWLANDEHWGGSASYGLTSRGLGGSYTQPRIQLNSLNSVHITHSFSGNRDQEVRLGNSSGPLAILRAATIGSAGRLDGSKVLDDVTDTDGHAVEYRRLLYSGMVSANYRYLDGLGPREFLQPQPSRFSGPALVIAPSVEYQRAAIPAQADATANNAAPARPGSRWDRVEFDAVITVTLTGFFPHAHGNYGRFLVEAYIQQFFGSAAKAEARTYIEVRSIWGALTAAAPRIDLFRLGGADRSRGLEDGEMAARIVWNESVQAGWRLAALFPALTEDEKEKSLLDTLYLNLMAEYGGVNGQSGDGPQFNPRHTAFSTGAGIRAFGILGGGLPGDSSLDIGYAWSPAGLRRSGRVYASVRLSFPP